MMLPLRRFLPSILALVAVAAPRAQSTATEHPFLWRIERTPPCYLYGTIHIPDPRVTDFPAIVENALAASDVVLTEIPMDDLGGAIAQMMLGKGESLTELLPAPLWQRLVDYTASKGMAPLVKQLRRMKIWAAIMTLVQLDFVDKSTRGEKALDQVIWEDGRAADKDLGGLETLAEQLGVFEAFTRDEQIEMLSGTMDLLEKLARDKRNFGAEMITVYLQGDEQRLTDMLEEYSGVADNPALEERFRELLIDSRNERMVARLVDKMQAAPDKAFFAAVGAAHYPGDKGILALLRARGFEVTRLPETPVEKRLEAIEQRLDALANRVRALEGK